MSQWIEAVDDAYYEMVKSYKVISPDFIEALPSEVRGVLLWLNHFHNAEWCLEA